MTLFKRGRMPSLASFPQIGSEVVVIVLFSILAIVTAVIISERANFPDELLGYGPAPREESFSLFLTEVFGGIVFDQPVQIISPMDSSDRIFIVLKEGEILVATSLQGPSTAFLDLRDKVISGADEEGLLNLAFDPNFVENGHFFVFYTADEPLRSVISRFTVSTDVENSADPSSELIIQEVFQPYAAHNGGSLAFGPDGYLYAGFGDGGESVIASENYPLRVVGRSSQDTSNLLGSIIRIDVSASTEEKRFQIPQDNPFVGDPIAKWEIWAYGFRNPWRLAFDSENGDLWVADVGQEEIEEVNIVERGRNYGWDIMQGDACFPLQVMCNTFNLTLPIIQYSHAQGCAVVGGVVYRGAMIEQLNGYFIYGDFCSGIIWGIHYEDRQVVDHVLIVDSDLIITSLSADMSGELLVVSLDGRIFLLTPEA